MSQLSFGFFRHFPSLPSEQIRMVSAKEKNDEIVGSDALYKLHLYFNLGIDPFRSPGSFQTSRLP